jgi:hypothetical protein
MKKLAALAFCLSAQAFSAPALVCKSTGRVDGWTGSPTQTHLRFTAYAAANDRLLKAKVSGAYESDTADVTADKKYVPKAAAYQGYNRFSALEDAWNWFAPLFPKRLLSQTGSFSGYLQIRGEEGFKGTVKLDCFLRR